MEPQIFKQSSNHNKILHVTVEASWNVMAHAQKPDFVFRRNRRVHLNRQGRQFSRLLAAEVCASAVVMRIHQVPRECERYWLPTPFASFPFTSPPVHHHVPSHFNWRLQNLDAQAIWHPHSIHCWYRIFYLPISWWCLWLSDTDHINKHSLHLKDLQVKSKTHHDPTCKNSRPYQPKYHVMPHHELTQVTSYSGSSHKCLVYNCLSFTVNMTSQQYSSCRQLTVSAKFYSDKRHLPQELRTP